MKKRSGFVSNSSTSSFVCNLCGEKYTGWDASPWDIDYGCYICPNAHVMCDEHITEVLVCIPEDEEDYTISLEECPVCQFKAYSSVEMASYLLKTRKVSRDEVFAKIKEANKIRKKLYDEEYITYVCQEHSLTEDSLLKELKEKFGTFDKYNEFIN